MLIHAGSSFEANVARTGATQTHINTLVLSMLRIRLFDPFEYPMPRSPFRLRLGERTIEGVSDEDAWIDIRVVDAPEHATIEWGSVEEEEEVPQGPGYPSAQSPEEDVEFSESLVEPPPDPEPVDVPPRAPALAPATKYLYEREIHLAFDVEEEEEATRQRIHNLGYNVWKSLEENVRAFQLTYQASLTGKASDIRQGLWSRHDACDPTPFPRLDAKHEVK